VWILTLEDDRLLLERRIATAMLARRSARSEIEGRQLAP
jgi:hypothetical protein